jgi:hypothetical protein
MAAANFVVLSSLLDIHYSFGSGRRPRTVNPSNREPRTVICEL